MSINDVGRNVRRYMKLQGFTIPKLASEMGMGTATISNILNGKSEPKSSTLIKFSEILDVKILDLIADVPKLNNMRFRTQKSLSAREKAERDQVLYKVAQWVSDFHDLEARLNQKSICKLETFQYSSVKELSMKVRDTFHIAPTEPVFDLPDKIEKAGVKLLLYPFGFKKTFGLSLLDKEWGPAIIVNSMEDISVERKIFTIAHELGHLVMHGDSYTILEDRIETVKEEMEADSFAGHFLLPDDALHTQWQESKGLHWVDAILKIKNLYMVSYQTVIHRLAQIYDALDYTELRIRFAQDYKRKYGRDLKNYYEPNAISITVQSDDDSRNEPAPLGSYCLVENRLAKLVEEAYSKGIISISRAGEILEKDPIGMRDLVSSWQAMDLNARL